MLNQGGCDQGKVIGLCDYFGGDKIIRKPEVIFIDNDQVKIYLRETTWFNEEANLQYSAGDIEEVHKAVEENYQDMFTVEDFENNNRKAPNESFGISRDEFQFNILMMHKIFTQEFFELLKKHEIKKIVAISFQEDAKLIKVSSTMELSLDSFEFHLPKIESIQRRLKMIYNSNLIFEMKEFFGKILKMNNNPHDSEEVNRFLKASQLADYNDFYTKPKCQESEVSDICNGLGEFFTHPEDGAALVNGYLVLVAPEEKIIKIMSERYKDPYDDAQKEKLISTYRIVNRKRGFEFRDFKNSGLLENRLSLLEWRSNIFMTLWMSSPVFNAIKKHQAIEKVLIIGTFGGKSVTTVIEFPREAFKDLDAATYDLDKLFFWKSKLDTFTQFIKDNSTTLKGF
jgi:hypothetical protein